MSKGSMNLIQIPLFSHNTVNRGEAGFISVVSMIIQLSHLPYLREHTQHGLDQVCHLLNALATMTVKMNEQIGTLKCSLISWGQMFFACIWTISRHMGGSKSNGSTSVSASLPQLSLAPSVNSLINMYQELMHKIASFFSGNEELLHQSSLGGIAWIVLLNLNQLSSYSSHTEQNSLVLLFRGPCQLQRQERIVPQPPSPLHFCMLLLLLIFNCTSLIKFAAWEKCNSRELWKKKNKDEKNQ